MNTEIEIEASTSQLGGEPRLVNTRIGISHIIQYYKKELSIDKILQRT